MTKSLKDRIAKVLDAQQEPRGADMPFPTGDTWIQQSSDPLYLNVAGRPEPDYQSIIRELLDIIKKKDTCLRVEQKRAEFRGDAEPFIRNVESGLKLSEQLVGIV